MSITFFVETKEVVSYHLTCYCDTSGFIVFNSINDAYSLKDNSPELRFEGCNDPDFCQNGFVDVITDTHDCTELNVSNFNGKDVLEVLGVNMHESGYCGEFDADDLMARINIALAVAPESAERLTYSEGNVIMGGRPEGYVQDKLHALIQVAEDAKNMDRKVLWS